MSWPRLRRSVGGGAAAPPAPPRPRAASPGTGIDAGAFGQALRASEERFRQAFDDAPLGLTVVDLDGRFTQVNGAMAGMTGYTTEELLTKSVFDITHADDIPAAFHELEVLALGEISDLTVDRRFIDSIGHTIWTQVHTTRLTGDDGSATGFLSHVQDVGDRRRYEEHLVRLASHDPLTGLLNRNRFTEELARHLVRCERTGVAGAVLVLDLDHFKRVNDALGHNAGDEVILCVAGVLRSALRSSDVVARLGGDQFAVLLFQGTAADAERVAETLEAAVCEGVSVLNGPLQRKITASVGVAVIDALPLTASQLLRRADLAMYDVKENGRKGEAMYGAGPQTVPRAKVRTAWADRIEMALEEDDFELHAQPIMDLRTNQITSHELLLRMRTADGDLVLPADFIYIAERIGLIQEIDRWVVARAISLLSRLQPRQPKLHLEVNVSGLSVGSGALREDIARSLAAANVDPSGMVFEITETAAVARIHQAREFADFLSSLGCRFALDDFGAGFGSFYYLKHMPCDYVKIDGEFIAKCTANVTDRIIIESLVGIARGLGKETIAEFVGDAETLDFLQSQRVDYAQGFHVGRPVPLLEAFPDLLLDPEPLEVSLEPVASIPEPRVSS